MQSTTGSVVSGAGTSSSFVKIEDDKALPDLVELEGKPAALEQVGTEGTMVIIFSIWKAMIGSAIVSLPWAFQQSGICLGSIITFTSFLVSYYTCRLLVQSTRNGEEFMITC